MALTDLSLCNLAIGRISGDPIDEIGEDSPLGAFCQENYGQKRDHVLGLYRWTFANRVALLAENIEPVPVRPMRHRYARPADLIGAVHDWRDTADPARKRVRPYVLDTDDAFWSDQAPLYAEYTASRPEHLWPTWFVELVVVAFAADLAGHAQMRGVQRDYETKAWGTPSEGGRGGLFGLAMEADARMAPQRQLAAGVDPGPLVEARYGGGGLRPGAYGFTLPGQG